MKRCFRIDRPRAGGRLALVVRDDEPYGMAAKKGDRIVVESEHVGTPPREGEILEVIERAGGTSFRVRWDDGHESMFTPSVGSATVVPRRARKKA